MQRYVVSAIIVIILALLAYFQFTPKKIVGTEAAFKQQIASKPEAIQAVTRPSPLPSVPPASVIAQVQAPANSPPYIAPESRSPAAAKIVESATTGTHLERLSPMIAPPPFDPVAYAKDPAAYVAEVVPGRVMQTAKPGPEGVPLTSLTKLEPEMSQGEAVELAVKAIPGAPVTFTAKDGGSFAENHLNSITLQAPDSGKVSVHFVADQGVSAYAEVMAGCPMTVGNTLFTIYVHYPGELYVRPAHPQNAASVPR